MTQASMLVPGLVGVAHWPFPRLKPPMLQVFRMPSMMRVQLSPPCPFPIACR